MSDSPTVFPEAQAELRLAGPAGAIEAAIDRPDPQHARAWHNLLQVQLREALLTAAEMQKTLNAQQPQAGQALGLGERLLDVMEQPGQDAGRAP